MNKNKSLRLHWDIETGWLLDVPFALPDHALRQAIRYALPRQIDRWRSLPPGDKKEQLAGAIKLLEQNRVRQLVVGERGDGKGDLIIYGG